MDAGNVSRASDDLVLGEQIAIAMGGDPQDVQLFPLPDPPRPQSARLHNYAHGGAQSGSEPNLEEAAGNVRIGFKRQVRAVRRHAAVYQSLSDVDVLISAGANDLLDQLEDGSAFAAVLNTKSPRDDRQLISRNAKEVARNLHYAQTKNYQATEIIIDQGHGTGFCMGNILKYAQRYGKKEGRNKNDLMKVINYAIIQLSQDHYQDDSPLQSPLIEKYKNS